MVMKGIPTDDPALMADLLGQARFVMAGLANTLLVLTRAITQDDLDGAELGRDAALTVAELQGEQAEAKRREGDVIEAEIMDKARVRFESIIDQIFGPSPMEQ